MAIANYFYNSTTRKYVAIFGTLFNQVKIQRTNNAGALQQEMIVPLSYAPFQKILARVAADPDLVNSTRPAMTLPRMSFEINNVTYDSQRKIATTRKVLKPTADENTNQREFMYSGVPYNIDFSLYIMTKYAEDATKIMEQILPFFTPDWTVTAKMIPEHEPVDIPIILNSVTTEDLYEGTFEERQSILYTLTFTLKGYYYGPQKTKKVIKFVDVDFYNGTDTNAPFVEGVDVRPGLSANGQPISSEGQQASARAVLSNGSVSSIDLLVNGEKYNANTTVTIAAPNTANASLTPTMTSGSVTAINILNGGGYFSTPPTVSFSVPDATPVTATGTITVVGDSITGATVTNPGNFYNTPTFTVSPPPNVASVFKFGDDALPHTTETDVTLLHTFEGFYSSNTGYKVQFWIYPTELTVGNPYTLLFAPFTKIYMNTTGEIGFQYSSQPIVTSDTNVIVNQWNHVELEHSGGDIRLNVNGVRGTTATRGAGNVALPGHTYKVGDAQGNESVFDGANRSFVGVIDNITFETQAQLVGTDGSSYTMPTTANSGDIFTQNFDKTLPTLSPTVVDGEITAITVINGGLGYTGDTPTITFDAPDDVAASFTASATPNLVDGVITSLTINNTGKFYLTDAIISVSAPTATTATATAVIASNGDVSSITVTDAGLGYRTVPTVTISPPNFGSIPYQEIEFDDDWGIIKTIVSE